VLLGGEVAAVSVVKATVDETLTAVEGWWFLELPGQTAGVEIEPSRST
jgi:hypothetical protein